MAYALQQLINGISLGMIYGLIAVGYTMVYGIIGMINFAHGDVFMVGAFVALISILLLISGGLMDGPAAILLVLAISMAFTALYGWTVERVAYRPLRGSFRLAPLISAIGMSIVLQNYVQVSQGARPKPIEPLITGGVVIMREDNFVVQLSNIQMLIIAVTHIDTSSTIRIAAGPSMMPPDISITTEISATKAPTMKMSPWAKLIMPMMP